MSQCLSSEATRAPRAGRWPCRGVVTRDVLVGVAHGSQSAQHAGAVGADGRAGGHDRGGEVNELQAAGRGRDWQADPPEAVGAKPFHRDHDRHFVAGPTAGTGIDAADERLVDLDHLEGRLAGLVC